MLKVFVYRNLHKDCWSIKALEGMNRGHVIAHAKKVTLWNCRFKVSEAGRQRVIKEQRKNVHAGVVGYVDDSLANWDVVGNTSIPVTYNPYKYDSFVRADEGHYGEPINAATFVFMLPTKEVKACVI